MFLVRNRWVIDNPNISLKDREILFITMTAAKFLIYNETREYTDLEKYPHIVCTGDSMICGGTPGILNDGYPIVNYEKVLEAVREEIKKTEFKSL